MSQPTAPQPDDEPMMPPSAGEEEDEPVLPPSIEEEADAEAALLPAQNDAAAAPQRYTPPPSALPSSPSAKELDTGGFVGRVAEQRRWRSVLETVIQSGRASFFSTLLTGGVNGLRRKSADGSIAQPAITAHVVLISGPQGIGKSALGLRLREIAQKEKAFARKFRTSWLDWAELAARDRRLSGRNGTDDRLAWLDTLYSHFLREDRFGQFEYYRHALDKYNAAQVHIDQAINKLGAEIKSGVFGAPVAQHAAPVTDLSWLAGLDAPSLAFATRQLAPLFAAARGWAGQRLETTGATIEQMIEQEAVARAIGAGLRPAPSGEGLRAFDGLLRQRLGQYYPALVEPALEVARALGEDMENMAASKPVIIFFDNYDIVDHADDVLQVVMAHAGPRCTWVAIDRRDLSHTRLIEGADKLEGAIETGFRRGYAELVRGNSYVVLPLADFSPAETAAYFATVEQHPLSDAEVEEVLTAVGGSPLALGTFGQLLGFEMSVSDTARTLAAQETSQVLDRFVEFLILSGHPDRLKLAALGLAALPDAGLLGALFDVGADSLTFETVMHRLQNHFGYLFARQTRLHPLVEGAIRRYLIAADHRFSDSYPARRLNRRAVAYLVKRLLAWQQNFQSMRGRVRDAKWGEWAVALAWHLFWLDEAAAWQLIVPLYIFATAYQPDLAPRLLDVVAFFSEHHAVSAEGQALYDALDAAARLDFADRDRAVRAWQKLAQAVQKTGLDGLVNLESLLTVTNARLDGDTDDGRTAEYLQAAQEIEAIIAYKLAVAYFYAENWQAAIEAGERAIARDPRFVAVPANELRAVLAEARQEARRRNG